MAEKYYKLSMPGAEAEKGIKVGMQIGEQHGIPYSDGNGNVVLAKPGEDYGYPLLTGNAPPTPNVAASFGQHYYDLSATKPPFEYICVDYSEDGGFVWRQHNDEGHFMATYGTTSYQTIVDAHNLGKICVVLINQDLYYLSKITSGECWFSAAPLSATVSAGESNAKTALFFRVRVTSSNSWATYPLTAELTDNRTTVINEQSTDAQYPSAKSVYTYGQRIDSAAQGYADNAKKAAKDYTDEQLEPVAATAGKAEDYALGAYVTPTASGDIASFDDGADGIPVKSLVVDIEPVQDLNGYDAPWPPGGGKNLFNAAALQFATCKASGDDTSLTLTQTGNYGTATAEIPVEANTDYAVSFIVEALYQDYAVHCSIDTGTSNYVGIGQAGRFSTTINSGESSVIYVRLRPTGVSNVTGTVTFKELMVEAGSTATAYEPYSNICPITGWTGAKVTRAGRNLAVSAHTVAASDIYNFALFLSAKLMPSTIYTLSFDAQADYRYYVNEKVFEYTNFSTTAGRTYVVVKTLPSLDKTQSNQYVESYGWAILKNLIDQPGPNNFENVQLELGSTASAYEPYAADSYSISFPDAAGTVYGGTLDVTTRLLTVDRAMVDMGALTWGAWETTGSLVFQARVQTKVPLRASPLICSAYAFNPYVITWGDLSNGEITGGSNNYVYVRDTAQASAGEFATTVQGVQLVYELAAPVTYQLTPTEVNTLLGVNNIWADTGDVSVTYRADPTLIYSKLTAAIISSGGAV